MLVKKFVKVDKDILLEYIYDSENLISEPYTVIKDSRTNKNMYVASNSSNTFNKQDDNLFVENSIRNNYAKIDFDKYSYLNPRNYGSGVPIKHDKLKIHLPTNYNFAQYAGCYIRIYAYDYTNKVEHDLTNYYFDISEVSALAEYNYTKPALYYQEQLWGKYLEIQFPSVYTLSQQRSNSRATENTMNHNLTNGVGFSITSPVMIDFRFISSKTTNTNNDTIFNLSNSRPASVPLKPEHESLGIMIEESKNGDYFEIYGIYNGNIGEFKRFIDNQRDLGINYYVNYAVTVYEENIRGKTQNITLTSNFNEKIDYRPIIKYSTTTFIIDVVMSLINLNDGSSIMRTGSLGMEQDKVSKYSLNLTKINVSNATKPKIYNLSNNSLTNNNSPINVGKNFIQVEGIKVPYPVLVDRKKIISRSENAKIGKDMFYGNNLLTILLYPYDNIISFSLAENYEENGIKFMNLSNYGNIKLCFKDDNQKNIECELYFSSDSNGNNLENGNIQFLLKESTIKELKKIMLSNNLFYITSTLNNLTTVLYSGRFMIYNEIVENPLPTDVENEITETERNEEDATIIISNPTEDLIGTAIVTRRYATTLDWTSDLVARIKNLDNQPQGTLTKNSRNVSEIINLQNTKISVSDTLANKIKKF